MPGNDGDVIRGLGFVTLYSARVEEDVDEILRLFNEIEPFDEEKQRWPITRKLKHAARVAAKVVCHLPSIGQYPRLGHLPEALKELVTLFKRRNEFVHGRIYAGHDKAIYLQAGRPNVPTREITPGELYDLANHFWTYRGLLILGFLDPVERGAINAAGHHRERRRRGGT